jgi:hypothetical protein
VSPRPPRIVPIVPPLPNGEDPFERVGLPSAPDADDPPVLPTRDDDDD